MLTALKEIVRALPQTIDRLNLEKLLSEQRILRYKNLICKSWFLISRTSRRFHVVCLPVALPLNRSDLQLRKKRVPAWIRVAGRWVESGTNLLRVAFVQAALGTKLSVSGDAGDAARGILVAIPGYSNSSCSRSGGFALKSLCLEQTEINRALGLDENHTASLSIYTLRRIEEGYRQI